MWDIIDHHNFRKEMIYPKFLTAAGLVILFSVTAINCQTANKQDPEKKEDYVTAWVKGNEENLYQDFMKVIDRDSRNKPGNEGLQMAYFSADTSNYLGKFTQLVRKLSDSIDVWYFYTVTNKVDSPGLKIRLTVNGNKKYAKVLDSLLNSSIQTKHFIVEKYEPPTPTPAKHIFENGEISDEKIRIEIIKTKAPYIVVVYIKGKKNALLLEEIQNTLHTSLLGEELMVKMVESVRYEFVDSLLPHFLYISQARAFLRKP